MQGKLNESVGCFERALRLVEKGRPANEDFRLCTAHTRQPLNLRVLTRAHDVQRRLAEDTTLTV